MSCRECTVTNTTVAMMKRTTSRRLLILEQDDDDDDDDDDTEYRRLDCPDAGPKGVTGLPLVVKVEYPDNRHNSFPVSRSSPTTVSREVLSAHRPNESFWAR
jgi:hypothetical protein